MKTKTDTYKISISETNELVEAYGSKEHALQGAIEIARERTRIYVSYCQWSAYWNDDGSITVKRMRRR